MRPNIYHQTENTSFITFSTRVYSEGTPPEDSMHFHKNYEIINVIEGICVINYKKKRFTIKKGEALFIEPFITHGIEIVDGGVVRSTTCHQNLIYTILNYIESYHPETPVFIPNPSVIQYYTAEMERNFGSKPFETDLLSPENMLSVKGCLYAIGAEFVRQAKFIPAEKTPFTLIEDMIEYIAENYKEDISMRDLANTLGYSYHYLSRTFNNALDMTFNSLLNHYRMEYAVALLHDTNIPIGEIIYKSGFKNQHSFNESCKNFYNKTPREIRNRAQLIDTKSE